MASDSSTYAHRRKPLDKRRRRRHRFSQLRLIALLVFVLCTVISVLGAGYGWLKGNSTLIQFSLVYAIVSFLFFVLYVVLNRRSYRGRSVKKSVGDDLAPDPAVSSSRSGGALVLVLVLILLLSGLLFQSQWMARNARQQADRIELDRLLRADAVFAVWDSLQMLADDEDLLVDHLGEAWAQAHEIQCPSGSSHVVRITDLNRFFDLNNLRLEIDTSTLRPAHRIVLDAMTLSGDFAPVDEGDALKDWVDADDQGYRERWFYEHENRGYIPRNDWFESWAELLLVDTIHREMWQKGTKSGLNRSFDAGLLDLLTLIPLARSGPVKMNINTASPEALTALLGFGQEDKVASIVTLRREEPMASLIRLAGLFSDPEYIQSVEPYVSVASSIFSVEVRSYLGGRAKNMRCLVQRGDDGTVEVLRWIM